MGFFNKERKEEKPKKPEDKVICPYCDKVIEKLRARIVFIERDIDEDDYERETLVVYCPHCKKILNIWNWE
jgi:uncharacterized protein with PIN domain